MKFTISLEPINEPDRKHWCDIGGCQEQVLFRDDEYSARTGKETWVCWLHGQLKLREDHQCWHPEMILDAKVRKSG